MLEVTPVSAFKDNYIWVIGDGRRAAVVDPGDAAPVIRHLDERGLSLCAILATHHHADHVGGVGELLKRSPVPVYGPAGEPIPETTRALSDGDHVSMAELGLELDVIGIPGHTRAHVAYYGAGMLFCGDTLFACGCGRLFEGTPEQMYASLQKLLSLPDDTKVYCGHEYTLANIEFARKVEPGNRALEERQRAEQEIRARGLPTLPSTLGRERATNPFLRCLEAPVIESANKYLGARAADPVRVFAAIREWKNKS